MKNPFETKGLSAPGRRGFTLIELLIVIAIILILIAIALPNFLEAQIRARVTKAKGEIRTIGIAQESYYLDFKVYPAEHERNQINRNQTGLFWLTHPIKYITSIPGDPFAAFSQDDENNPLVPKPISYETGGIEIGGSPLSVRCPSCMAFYLIFSNGPDSHQETSGQHPHFDNAFNNYSPTNGTISTGEIVQWGGDSSWIGRPQERTNNPSPRLGPTNPILVDGVQYAVRFPRN
jgi:prepilin-type N-terminal cleavage/methylation domain-containing protein